MKNLVIFFSILSVFVPAVCLGYPNGTPLYVTDMAPVCASCHSAAKAEYMPELPGDLAPGEISENKHYGLVRSPGRPSPYLELTGEQKEKIIKDAKLIDSNSTVTVTAPQKARPGEKIEVVIKVRGGNGPVVGIMLVDRALRYQARPVTSEGWIISGEPVVKGQDGKTQKTWLDSRIKGLKRNLNFIMIMDQKFDLEKRIFPSGEITYTLKAPRRPGTYTLSAAFLYGTENTVKAGFFQRPSGRILFSEEIKVRVK
jgi:hypothetical protein